MTARKFVCKIIFCFSPSSVHKLLSILGGRISGVIKLVCEGALSKWVKRVSSVHVLRMEATKQHSGSVLQGQTGFDFVLLKIHSKLNGFITRSWDGGHWTVMLPLSCKTRQTVFFVLPKVHWELSKTVWMQPFPCSYMDMRCISAVSAPPPLLTQRLFKQPHTYFLQGQSWIRRCCLFSTHSGSFVSAQSEILAKSTRPWTGVTMSKHSTHKGPGSTLDWKCSCFWQTF